MLSLFYRHEHMIVQSSVCVKEIRAYTTKFYKAKTVWTEHPFEWDRGRQLPFC